MVVRGKILTESGTIRDYLGSFLSLFLRRRQKRKDYALSQNTAVPYFGHILFIIIYIVSVYMVYNIVQEYTNKEGLGGGVNKKEEVGRGKKGEGGEWESSYLSVF